ncbi:hypothetical protein Tco_1234876 [Tanacetum coccineum]
MMLEERITHARENSALPHVVLIDDDFLTKVLIRLPILCIHLFTTVSKQWLRILTSPVFTLNRSKITRVDPHIGLFVNHISSLFHCDFVSLDPRIKSRKYTIDNSFTLGSTEAADNVNILQSCNGLLLCTVARDQQCNGNSMLKDDCTLQWKGDVAEITTKITVIRRTERKKDRKEETENKRRREENERRHEKKRERERTRRRKEGKNGKTKERQKKREEKKQGKKKRRETEKVEERIEVKNEKNEKREKATSVKEAKSTQKGRRKEEKKKEQQTKEEEERERVKEGEP